VTAPQNYEHVMVDIETMGGAPRGALLAIGAVPFSMHSERLELAPRELWYDKRCTLQANVIAGREIDAETVEWWMSQSDEARAMLVAEPRFADFRTLIYDFDDWIRHTDGFALEKVWAKPPEFDIDILKHAFDSVGAEWPFYRRSSRDLRTTLDHAEFQNRTDILGLEFEGEKHNAAHDAAHQARQVILAYGGQV